MKNFTAALLVAFSPLVANAASFMEACPNLDTCVKTVSELLGESYITGGNDLKCTYKTTSNLPLNKDNATLLFTGMLNQCGLSRVPFGAQGVYRIERINDAKGMNVPTYTCSHDEEPKIPDTWDQVKMEYKMSHPESVKHLENLVRTYASMGARIYGYEADGTLIITETGVALKELYKFIRSKDVKITAEMLKKWKDEEQRWHAEKLAEARTKSKVAEAPEEAKPPKKK